MKKNISDNTLRNFMIFGILFSILFLLAIFTIALISNDYAISFYNISKIHREFKILYVIDFTPIIFVLITYWLGHYYSRILEKFEENIDSEIHRSKITFNFIEELRQGNIEAKLENIDEKDELASALINLRNEIKRSRVEEETRKREDEQRNWVSGGLAKFGAILRENIDNLEKLSSEVTSNLVKYIDAKQAAFFILDESGDEKFFNMTAHFAYGRKKFPEKKLLWGEGLIGACALEKKTIFITEVTENFVEVTSGLGKANPKCILIVPLKNNEEIHGVLELASFKVYEPFEVNFVEMIAESIASTISNVKINMRTKQLLNESQNQAEIMANQENEMRKNMEELKLTQIEAAKQSEQFISFTNSVNHTLIRAEYSIDGKLLYANTKFISKLGYISSSEVEGKHISMFISEKDKQWFDELWQNLAKGGKHYEGDMKHITKSGNDIWTIATYVSVRDLDGKPQKILFLGIDITEDKKVSIDFKEQIEAFKISTLKAEYKPDGVIMNYNNKMFEATGLNEAEISGKTVFDFIGEENIEEFQVIWKNILAGIPHEGRQQKINPDGEIKWFKGTYSLIKDLQGEPLKIVFIASDISELTSFENKNKEQTEILKEQENKLQEAKLELNKKLDQSREEMKLQFREVETVKMLNDKTFEGLMDAVISLNIDNVVTSVNKSAEKLFNLKQDEFTGKNISAIFPENEITNQTENYIGKFLKVGENSLIGKRGKVAHIDKEGKIIPLLMTLSEAKIGTRFSLTAFIQKIEE